jgi:hypothetical protein
MKPGHCDIVITLSIKYYKQAINMKFREEHTTHYFLQIVESI